MTYVTVSNVRDACGAPSSLISDTKIEHAIDFVEKSMERFMNTKFAPTLQFDILDGTGTDRFFAEKVPLLKPVSLKNDGTSIDIDTIHVDKDSGRVRLGDNSDDYIFPAKPRSIVFKYYYGLVERDESVQTTSTADAAAGSSVSISVSDETDFSANDWVEVIGGDGHVEVFQVSSTSANVIVADSLILTHESGSLLYKMSVPTMMKRWLEVECSIYVALNAIGSTYTFSTSYSIGDFSTNKGVPYPHWNTSLQQNLKEREFFRNSLKPRIKVL